MREDAREERALVARLVARVLGTLLGPGAAPGEGERRFFVGRRAMRAGSEEEGVEDDEVEEEWEDAGALMRRVTTVTVVFVVAVLVVVAVVAVALADEPDDRLVSEKKNLADSPSGGAGVKSMMDGRTKGSGRRNWRQSKAAGLKSSVAVRETRLPAQPPPSHCSDPEISCPSVLFRSAHS